MPFLFSDTRPVQKPRHSVSRRSPGPTRPSPVAVPLVLSTLISCLYAPGSLPGPHTPRGSRGHLCQCPSAAVATAWQLETREMCSLLVLEARNLKSQGAGGRATLLPEALEDILSPTLHGASNGSQYPQACGHLTPSQPPLSCGLLGILCLIRYTFVTVFRAYPNNPG